MESTHDLAINTLNVLDDAEANGREGCATFNGGINVTKNIVACDIDVSLLTTIKAKISDCMAVQKDLYVEGNILPFSKYSNASLGAPDCKWNNVNTIGLNAQQSTMVTLVAKNSSFDNVKLKTHVINIVDTSANTMSYVLNLPCSINIIHLNSTYVDNRMIIMELPFPDIGSNNDIKKVVLKQNKPNSIKWKYDPDNFMSNNSLEQAFDLINVNGTWELIDYSNKDENAILENSIEIDEIKEELIAKDLSLNSLDTKINDLIDMNEFLKVSDLSGNTILDFLGDQDDIKDDILSLQTSLNTITDSLASIITLSTNTKSELTDYKTTVNSDISELTNKINIIDNTVDIFKTVTHETFTTINSKFIGLDSHVSGFNLKISELNLDVKRAREMADLIDKKLTDHICSTDSKMKYLDNKMKHMDDKINILLQKCNVTFC